MRDESSDPDDEGLDAAVRSFLDWAREEGIGSDDVDLPSSAALEASTSDPESRLRSLLRRLADADTGRRRYRVVRELARGGMGVVQEVWDEDLRRRLAMKTMAPELGQDLEGAHPRRVARFLEEAQISGQLDHPGVVPVHELGVDADGRAYFTMQLVRGQSLKEVFELVGDEKEDWSLTRALPLLLRVCETMAFAHDKGVIHRDLKPANIMVGRYGEVYVMDWGLARVRDHPERRDLRLRESSAPLSSVHTDRRDEADADEGSPLVTMDGAVVGTPYYMSPEQADGRLDDLGAHSDVYSLGAMLYELLTGGAPYSAPGSRRSPRTVLAMVMHGPPRPIRGVAPSIPPELVAICERAMARDVGDRYQDMGEVAAELRAYLEHRVVHAYETGAVAELRKWVVRNKGVAASIALATALTIVGLGRTSYVEARASERTARERDVAEQVTDLMIELFESPDPHHARGKDVTAREILDRGAASIETRSLDPLVQARLETVLGESYRNLGDLDAAESLLESAFRTQDERLRKAHPHRITTLSFLTALYGGQGRFEAAQRVGAEMLALSREEFGDEDLRTLMAMNDLAQCYQAQYEFDEADRLLVDLLEACKRVYGPDDRELILAQRALGDSYYWQGRLAEAAPLIEQAVAGARRSMDPDDPYTLSVLRSKADFLYMLERYIEAEGLYTEVLEAERRVLGEGHGGTLWTAVKLAGLHIARRNFEEAEAVLRPGYEASKLIGGEKDGLTLSYLQKLGECELGRGRYEDAEAALMEALVGWQELRGDRDGDTLGCKCLVASLREAQGRDGEAEALLLEVLEGYLAPGRQDLSGASYAQEELVRLYEEQERHVEALPLLMNLVVLATRMRGEGSADASAALMRLEQHCSTRGLWAEALPEAEDLLASTPAEGVAFPTVRDLVSQIRAVRAEAPTALEEND